MKKKKSYNSLNTTAKLQNRILQLESELNELKSIAFHNADKAKNFSSYVHLFEHGPIAYLSLSPEGKILNVNSCMSDLLGYSKQEMLQKPFVNFLTESSKAHLQSCFLNFQKEKTIASSIIEFITKDGRILQLLRNGKAEFSETGEFVATHCVYTDITQQIEKQTNIIQSRYEWQVVFDSIGLPIIILDSSQIILYANKAVIDFTGLAEDKIIGEHCYKIFHNSSCNYPPQNCPAKKLLETQSIEQHEMACEMFDETFLVSCTPLFNEQGEIKNIIHIATNISEKIAYEKKILLSEERYRNVVSNMPIISFVIESDGTVSLFEGKGVEKLKLQPKQIVGRSVFDICKEYPEIASSVTRALQGENIHNKFKVTHGMFNVMYNPIKNTHDKNYKIIGLAIDITEREKALQKIHEKEEQYRLLFTQMEQGVAVHEVIYDSNGAVIDYVFLDCNKGYERHTKLLKKDIVGKRVTEVLPNIEKYWIEAYGNVVLTGNSLHYENYAKELDAYFDVVVYKPQKDQFAVIVTDITERKKHDALLKEQSQELEAQNEEYLQINEKLLQANQELYELKEKAIESDSLKSSFLANLSHEIRNPMNAILGFSDLLHDAETTQIKEHYISIIQKSGDQLMSIINDIIDVSKIETGQVKPYYENIFLLPFILEIHRTLEITIPKEKNIRFDIVYDNISHNTVLYVDRVKLHQILTNLISNAIKFTNTGKITFTCSMTSHKEIKFSVSDTGIGIDKEHFSIIFDRFRQIENDSQIKQKGSGLGLSISKAYIEMMGGEISIVSKKGKGSCFTVTIPNLEKPQRIDSFEKSDKKVPVSEPKGNNELIVIAEDDDVNYYYLSRLFAHTNFQIIRAFNGKEAVELVEKNPDVKLVLMDIKMPIMNGYEAARHIQKKFAHIPIIAQTAYALTEDETKINDAGFQGYIRKPIKRDALFSILNTVFQS